MYIINPPSSRGNACIPKSKYKAAAASEKGEKEGRGNEIVHNSYLCFVINPSVRHTPTRIECNSVRFPSPVCPSILSLHSYFLFGEVNSRSCRALLPRIYFDVTISNQSVLFAYFNCRAVIRRA